MKRSQIAAQLYTVRDHCGSQADLAKTLDRLRLIGYGAVELSGVSGDIPAGDLRRILDDSGMTVCATHEAPDLIRKSPLEVVEKLQTLGVACTAYPYPAGVDFRDAAAVKAMVSDLESAGAVLREHGITLTYHNHAIEFLRIGNEVLLDYIARAVPSDHLGFELDTYWVQYGGGNPVVWIEKLTGRLPVLHCKDYAFGVDNTPHFAEIGYGNLDFADIISAGDAAGVRWFVVEQDTCPGDPFVSLDLSYKAIAGLAEG